MKEVLVTIKLTKLQLKLLFDFVTEQYQLMVDSPVASSLMKPLVKEITELRFKLGEAEAEFPDLEADAEARAEIVADDDIPF